MLLLLLLLPYQTLRAGPLRRARRARLQVWFFERTAMPATPPTSPGRTVSLRPGASAARNHDRLRRRRSASPFISSSTFNFSSPATAVAGRAGAALISNAAAAATAVAATTALAAVIVALQVPSVAAHPAYQGLIPNGANVSRGGNLWPAVGHMDASNAGSLENSFGLAFAAAGHTWTRALCEADTDGDGFTNGEELGDPGCAWYPGMAAPARTTDISHPGFADSFPPTNTIFFRIHGPTAYEGLLQARVYPNPYGTVNFGYTTSVWAREYCERAGAYEGTVIGRVTEMRFRPPENYDYLPRRRTGTWPSATAVRASAPPCSTALSHSAAPAPRRTPRTPAMRCGSTVATA